MLLRLSPSAKIVVICKVSAAIIRLSPVVSVSTPYPPTVLSVSLSVRVIGVPESAEKMSVSARLPPVAVMMTGSVFVPDPEILIFAPACTLSIRVRNSCLILFIL